MRYLFPSAGVPKLNPNSGQAQDLLAWYPITKHDTIARLRDYSGKENDAIASIGEPLISGTVRGISADFRDATISNYIATLTIPANHTVCVRYYGTVEMTNAGLWSTSNVGVNDLTVLLANANPSNNFAAYANGFLAGTINSASRLNDWVDIIISTNASNERKLYIDGNLDVTGALEAVVATSKFIVGSYTETGTLYMQGFLKDVRLYGKVFTDAEAFAYSNPATRYNLWAEPKRSRRITPITIGACISPSPIVLAQTDGGTCISPLPIVSAVLVIDGTGTGVLQAPLLTILGTGLTGEIGTSTLQNPLPTVSAVVAPVAGAFVVPALPSVAGTGFMGAVGVVALQPQLSASIATVLNGSVSTGAVNIPLSTVNGAAGDNGSVQSPITTVTASGVTGRVSTGAVRSSFLQVTGVLVQTPVWSGNAIAVKPVILGEMLPGTLNVGDVQNKFSVINAVGLSGGVSVGAFNLPLLKVNAAFVTEGISIGEILIPLPDIRGNGLSILSNYITWVLNTESNRVTNYTQFPFIALGLLGINPIGATADGLYLLAGDNDDGQLIASVFKFGMTDFRSELVDNADVYVGGDIEGDMEVGILEDGQDDENIYTLFERERHVRGHHAKLGKGFRSRYRQLSISNVNGGNFDLDSLSLPSRDLRGNE